MTLGPEEGSMGDVVDGLWFRVKGVEGVEGFWFRVWGLVRQGLGL